MATRKPMLPSHLRSYYRRARSRSDIYRQIAAIASHNAHRVCGHVENWNDCQWASK
jgi:hypothetical protein